MPQHANARFDLYQPQWGCGLLVLFLFLLCLLPIFMVEAMQAALERLHLSSAAAVLAVLGILLGGFINIPIWRYQRETEQVMPQNALYLLQGWVPLQRRVTETIVAANVGGCIIPTIIALYEASFLLEAGAAAKLMLVIVINIAVCYALARPMQGIGIALPVFAAPLAAVGAVWLLFPAEYRAWRPPAAFIAGVAGPLLGADLLNIRQFTRVSVGVISIGGAGTFDAIVLSAILATLLV